MAMTEPDGHFSDSQIREDSQVSGDAAPPADPRGGNRGTGPSSRQMAKSEAMRERVLQAAVDCLVDSCAGDLSIATVAKRAGISRGGVQYHFATRQALLCAVMECLNDRRLCQFRQDLAAIRPGQDISEHLIEAHWRHLQEPDFRAYQELVLAARGDPDLVGEFGPRYNAFLQEWKEAARTAFGWSYLDPDVARAGNIAHYVLEGMAYGQLVGQLLPDAVQDLLDYAKSVMRKALEEHPGQH